MNEQEKGRGRPPAMSPEIQDEILEHLEAGKGNREACQMVGISHECLYSTIARNAEFADRYRQAKQAAVDALVDEANNVNRLALGAETGAAVAAHKHLADALRWEASRRVPQRWGEKASVELTGRVDITDQQELAKRLAFIEAMTGGGDGDEEE